ncbi:MAG: substrate-binding domain-containing protein, partial [Puniceicoccales bacterium]
FNGFAVAAMGHSITTPALPRVASDIYAGCFLAFDELIRRGYRRIGLINTDYVNRLACFLYSGALSAYQNHVAGENYFTEWISPHHDLQLSDMDPIVDWIRREKLDAVTSPLFGIPLYQLLLESGLKIPQELGYLHLLDFPESQEVTQLSQKAEFMGTKAVDMVVAAINRNEFEQPGIPHVINTMGKWLEGTTLPQRTSAQGHRQADKERV